MNVDYSQAAAQEQRDIPTHGEYLLAGLEDVPEIALDAFGLTREAVDAYGIRWRPERYGKRGAVYPDAFMFGIRDPASGRLWGTHRKDADGAWTSPGTPKGQTLFGIERFQSGGTAILVESPLDTAVLLAAGLDGGLASFGAKVSQRQAALLSERASRIVLALDNDPAGRAAQRALAGRLSIPVYCFNYGDALSLVRPGRAKDPGEMEADDLRWAIRHAT
jgi:hypothetical protein